MVFNGALMVGVANVSADACQYIACNPERLSSDQVLRLLFVFPFQQLRRLALCLWTFFCFPPSNPYLSSSSSSLFSSESDIYDLEDLHTDWSSREYLCIIFECWFWPFLIWYDECFSFLSSFWINVWLCFLKFLMLNILLFWLPQEFFVKIVWNKGINIGFYAIWGYLLYHRFRYQLELE